MDNYEILMDTPGVENCHPKFIGLVRGVKCVVAEVVDGVVYLTDAGKELLADGSKTSKKSGKKVQSANTSVGSDDDTDQGV